jgi:DNA invertase Pin-like site-specific DNA recombinase
MVHNQSSIQEEAMNELVERTYAPGIAGQSKLTKEHWKRLACVYVRQSTLKQVERNRESQVNQYQLVERAELLGWSRERIRVIDADLGISGQSSTNRTGFKELVAEVSLGHVGVIFGYEVSRLARNNGDWYHLLDLAAVFGTLIADTDGIYDPKLYNDRLLLGLKGTMSEAELHLIRNRLDAGRLSQVQRGEFRQLLPTGLLRLSDGSVIKDPDEGIRHTIDLVFHTFDEQGSCRQVVRVLRQAGVLLPRRQTGGMYRGQLLWKEATEAAVSAILHNPAYAGAFVYGRRPSDPTRQMVSNRPIAVRKPQEEWIALKQDVYPAYISWEQYLANQDRLKSNEKDMKKRTERSTRAQGAVGQGEALLQGLVVCGVCGHHLHVSYRKTPRYCCIEENTRMRGPKCVSVQAPPLDELVTRAFFEALRPAQLDALDAVLADQEAEYHHLLRHFEERVKRTRYAAQLAQRQYSLVDPENRLVAASLEQRWEAALRELAETEEAYTRQANALRPQPLSAQVREQFRHISETLPTLWSTGQITPAQQKTLLRALIQQVIIRWETSDTVVVCLVWISGHYTTLQFVSTVHRTQDLAQYETFKERIHDLWSAGMKDQEIAAQMTREGFHSARSTRVSEATVCKVRLHYRWQRTPDSSRRYTHSEPGYLSVRDLAERLSCDVHWVYRQIEAGRIDAAYLKRCPPRNAYLIQDHPELLAFLHEAKKQAEELGQQRLAKKTRKRLPSFSEVSAGRKQNTIVEE